MIVKGNPYDLV